MFDTGQVSDRGLAVARPQLDPELLAKIKPINLSHDRLIDVPEPLKPLFPVGGVERGWSLGLGGDSSWSVAMALLAVGLGEEGWVAIVGVPAFNLVAAAEYGLRLDRVLLVDEPGPGRWATVVATLLESVDVVVVAPQTRVGARDARRLAARAREQESVLFHLDGGKAWPTALNLLLTVNALEWQGLGEGHGHLRARRVQVEARGRRGGSRSTCVEVWLPNEQGKLEAVAGTDSAGSDSAGFDSAGFDSAVPSVAFRPRLVTGPVG